MADSDRINAERLVLLSWPRAILLQLAHPLVAAGVAGHSGFRDSPVASARRLHDTVRAMLALTFGTESQRAQAVGGIRAIHQRVRGTLRETVGAFRAGTPYSAEDPDLLLWVHATVIESAVMAYDALITEVPLTERDAYCREAATVAVALGVRTGEVPRDWAALARYMTAMSASGTLQVGPDARLVAEAVLRGPLTTIAGPVASINRRLTVGWLPADIRRQYGFDWSAGHERQLHRVARALRSLRRMMPDAVALWPEAHGHARR